MPAFFMHPAYSCFSTVFRRGRGDLFVGLLYTMEATVPLTCIRSALGCLKKQESRLYIINALVLTLVYFIVRICIFPMAYFLYYFQHKAKDQAFLTSMPFHCHLGTCAILSFQTFWFGKLWRETRQLLNGGSCKAKFK